LSIDAKPLNRNARPEFFMRIPIAVLLAAGLAAAATTAPAQRLGARTTSPEQMVSQMNPDGPEEELRRQVAVADAHPLGTVENPIRVGGPEGERAYLGRLRCPGGAVPTVGARGTVGVGAFGSVVAGFDVACGNERRRIVFDMYHEEHVETRAPAGFTLAN
jgi:hypothetical protein